MPGQLQDAAQAGLAQKARVEITQPPGDMTLGGCGGIGVARQGQLSRPLRLSPAYPPRRWCR